MATIFEEKYKKLNQSQKEAVNTIEGPVMVIAGPGTGKTTILTLRIANILLKTDTPASGILAITFTEAGVKSMRMKLREVIAGKADEVRIHTFHGFAASIIHEFPDHFAHISRSKQITDIEAESIIREILQDKKFASLRPFGNPDLYLGSILRTIGDAKKEAWTPTMLRSFCSEEIERVKGNAENISTRGESKGKFKAEALKRIEKCEKTALFADVYEVYEAKKKEKNNIDFDDLIIELLLSFERDELLLRLVQEKFLYILVDEHQDTNDSQNLLIRTLANFFDEPNLFVVGDEKQAIYRFQGASVKNFLTFQSVWKYMKIISLRDNYRSHQKILDAGFSLIENNYDEGEHANLRIPLLSGAQQAEKPIEVVTCGNLESHDDYLVKKLQEVIRDKEVSVAIITRTNRDVERVLSVCESHEIPASAERGADIFSHPFGSIFFDIIEFLNDPSKFEFLARTLAVGLWGLRFEESVMLIREIRAGNLSSVVKKIPVLNLLSKDLARLGSIEYLIKAATISGYSNRAVKDPLTSEIWRGIVSLAQDIASKDGISDPKILINALLSYRATAETKTIKIPAGISSAQVSIMTAHGSKGLEYDYVFIPRANEEVWMPRARSSYFVLPKEREEGDEIRDARRLFYVALTRAKRHAVILSSATDFMGRELAPLRFISEIAEKNVQKIDVPTLNLDLIHKSTKEGYEVSSLVEFAKNALLERGLSVTALNHFKKCPNLFFYKSILRVPEPPSASSEKGTAMHEALSRIWLLEDRNEKTIASTIIDSIKDYFRKSLLPRFEKDALIDELIEDAPIVAKALLPHFMTMGNIRVETMETRQFKIEIDGKEIEMKLHGRLDALIEADKKTFVFDYKTKEAMSTAAIRGETKNDDGGYFRQLIYYKMLLSENPKYKGTAIEPSLVFIKPDSKGRCPSVTIPVTKDDEKRVEGEIKELIGSVWRGEILKQECDDKDCDGCRLRRAAFND